MATVSIDGEKILDWTSFHAVCKEAFGFPEFYGMNMNAWIDCLTYLYEGDGMSSVVLSDGEYLDIEITDSEGLKFRLPEIWDALIHCTAFVNDRYLEMGQRPPIRLLVK